MEVQGDQIPVTLLTGFLGAGKTTLLNHLIRDPDAGRVAVIMNEFGDVGLDHDLIEAQTEETILMQSGCLCCTIRGDLLKTLGRLMAQRNRGALSFDRVVIETTGIADPGPILHSLVVDHIVGPYFRMDGVVTVADAATGSRTLDKQFEAVHQIAMADVIILSKTDLVTPVELARFEARLAGINTTARRVQGEHGRVPTGILFGLSAMRGNVTADDVSTWLGVTKTDPLSGLSRLAPVSKPSMPLPIRPSFEALPHHDNRITSASIEIETPISAEAFDLWLDTLVAFSGPDILRVKGIVHVEDMASPFVFHGVQHIFHPPVALPAWPSEDRRSRLVFITDDVSRDVIQKTFNALAEGMPA